MRVVADTSPLNYLSLIDCAEILPRLFGQVAIPSSVRSELQHPETPEKVRAWLMTSPSWLATHPVLPVDDIALAHLDDGERDAIQLAGTLHANLVLMDERAGVAAARARGHAVTGTLGLLDRGARNGWVSLPNAVERLRHTNFRCQPTLFQALLNQHRTP